MPEIILNQNKAIEAAFGRFFDANDADFSSLQWHEKIFSYSVRFLEAYQEKLPEGVGVVAQTMGQDNRYPAPPRTLLFDVRQAGEGRYWWELTQAEAGQRTIQQLLVTTSGMRSRHFETDGQGRWAGSNLRPNETQTILLSRTIIDFLGRPENIERVDKRVRAFVSLKPYQPPNRTRRPAQEFRIPKAALVTGQAVVSPALKVTPAEEKKPSFVPFERDAAADSLVPLALELIAQLDTIRRISHEAQRTLNNLNPADFAKYTVALRHFTERSNGIDVSEAAAIVGNMQRLLEEAHRYEGATSLIRSASRWLVAEILPTFSPSIHVIGERTYWVDSHHYLCSIDYSDKTVVYFNRYDEAGANSRMASLEDYITFLVDMNAAKALEVVA